MAGVNRLVPTKDLKTNFLGELIKGGKQKNFFYYDTDLDELIIMAVPPEMETVVHYIEGEKHVAIIYQADTLEIVGLQIEDFQKGFIPKYSSVEKVWRLSDCIDVKNVGDMMLKVELMQPKIAREVAKASIPLIGEPAKRLEKVFA
jgi:hypothetical protein